MSKLNYLNCIKTICTDLLFWIYFVPLWSGSGDKSVEMSRNYVILLKLISENWYWKKYRSETGIELKVSVSKFFERYPALVNMPLLVISKN